MIQIHTKKEMERTGSITCLLRNLLLLLLLLCAEGHATAAPEVRLISSR